MMIARPTAASPAATVITKIAKTCPSRDERRWENATRLMFTALSISSTAMSTVIMLRRITTPMRPTAKSVADNMRYACVVGTASAIDDILDFSLRLDPVDHVRGRGLFFHRAQLALADDDRADHRHEQEQRRDLERDEIVGIQRHADGFGVSDDRLAHHRRARDAAVRVVHATHAMRLHAAEVLRRAGRVVKDAGADERGEEEQQCQANAETALPELREDALIRQMPDVDPHE